jgi:hypothetical protein
VLSDEDYAKFVKGLKKRTEPMMTSELGAKCARLGLISERTLWVNANSTSHVRTQLDMRRDMVRAHRQVELELFGRVTDLPGEQELLQGSSVGSAGALMQPGTKQVRTVEAGGGRSFAVSVRRTILFLLVMSIAYFFIWVPWRNSPANFLFFFGFGMIQIAAVYTQDLRDSVMAYDSPPLFTNPFMLLFVSGLALLGFVIELKIGGKSKVWWEAALLTIPPVVFASYTFPRTDPVRPFFVGIAALLLAVVLKIV